MSTAAPIDNHAKRVSDGGWFGCAVWLFGLFWLGISARYEGIEIILNLFARKMKNKEKSNGCFETHLLIYSEVADGTGRFAANDVVAHMLHATCFTAQAASGPNRTPNCATTGKPGNPNPY